MKKTLIYSFVFSSWSLAFGQAPNWNVDGSQYAHNMNITGTLYDNCVQAMEVDDEIGIFAGTELRGSGKCANTNNGEGIIFITLYSNQANGEVYTVKFYDASADATTDLTGNDITFVSSDVVGTITDPHDFWIGLTPIEVSIENNQGTLNYTGDSTGISGLQYQWLLDGNPISGATNSTYTPTETGDYSVEVTAPGYCEETSNVEYIFIDVTAVDDEDNLSLQIAPNPCNDKFEISLRNVEGNSATVRVYNALGELVYDEESIFQQNEKLTINTDTFVNGIYLVNVEIENRQIVRKLSIHH